MISDANIDWARKRLWLTPDTMQGVDCALGQAGETAGVTPAELTNIGMNSWIMTDGELMNGYIPCPFDLDPKHEIGFKVCWTMDFNAGTPSAKWILLVGTEKEGQAISVPATALDTPIADDSYVTDAGAAGAADWLLQWTSRGIWKSTGLTKEDIQNGAFLTFKLEMDKATAETTIRYIGMMMDYCPWKTLGLGCEVDRPLNFDISNR
jgi:hypothetical protein